MLAVLLGLTAAVAYGASDFLGGLASRRSSVAAVVVVSHGVAGLVMLAAAPLFAVGPGAVAAFAWGAAAGVANVGGSVFLYRGLSRGRMAVVSPLTGVVAAAIPVAFGLVTGERPGPVSLAGVVVALAAIVLVSSAAPRGNGPRVPAPGGPAGAPVLAAEGASWRGRVATLGHSDVADGLASGTSYGAFFVLLAQAGAGAAVWPLVGVQVATLAVLVPAALLTGRSVRPRRPDLGMVAVAGILGAGGNAAYLVAASLGLMSLVAVLASLYPAATVLLARVVLEERWSRLQVAGLLCAAAGVATIASG